MDFISLLSVCLLSIAPVGGIGAAVPAGIALGLSPWVVLLATTLASALPAALLPPLAGLATRHPKVSSWVARRRTEKATRFFERYGVWGMSTVGRFVVGPYGSLLTLELFGVSRRRTLVVFTVGSLLLALFFYFLTLGGLALLRSAF